jgi:hypothetical protein
MQVLVGHLDGAVSASGADGVHLVQDVARASDVVTTDVFLHAASITHAAVASLVDDDDLVV